VPPKNRADFINVRLHRDTYYRLVRLRDRFKLKSINSAVVMLLDLYDGTMLSIDEAVMTIMRNTAKLIELVEELDRKVTELARAGRPVPVPSPVPVPAPAPLAEPADEDLPSYLVNNPWVEILRNRKRG